MTFGTSDHSDEKTWPDQQKDNGKDKHNEKGKDKDNDKEIYRAPSKSDLRDLWQRQRQRQRHLEDTFKQWHQTLVTFEASDQSNEETWPDQQKDNDKDKCKGI